MLELYKKTVTELDVWRNSQLFSHVAIVRICENKLIESNMRKITVNAAGHEKNISEKDPEYKCTQTAKQISLYTLNTQEANTRLVLKAETSFFGSVY